MSEQIARGARQHWRVAGSSSQIHGPAEEGGLCLEGKRVEVGTDIVWCSLFKVYSGCYEENRREQSVRGGVAPVGYFARL